MMKTAVRVRMYSGSSAITLDERLGISAGLLLG
jgi:hypothetical protein